MDLVFLSFNLINIFIVWFIFEKSAIISRKINLYKKLDDQTPLIGGLGIYLFFIIFNLSLYIFKEDLIINGQLSILIVLSVVFAIGLIDDLYQISYAYRLIFIYLVLIIFFKYNDAYIIDYLYFETTNKTILLGKLSLFLTPFFILLLLNSLNMADGINGNSTFIVLSYLFLLIENNLNLNSIAFSIIPPLLLFLYYNLKNKIYLGDSGIYLLSVIISLYVISKYNSNDAIISCEKIFLIFLIPGIDMFRLFILRLLKKRNPFKGDKNHFHHLLEEKFKAKKTLIIYLILINWPNFLIKIFDINVFILIFINILLFVLLINYLQKLRKFS